MKQKIWDLIEKYQNEKINLQKKPSELLKQSCNDDISKNTLYSYIQVQDKNNRKKTPNNGNTKNVQAAVPFKHLSNFWKTLEITLIKCAINSILTWSSNCVITSATGAGTFAITVN